MRKRKWKSATFWITLWSMAVVSYIVVYTPAGSVTMQSVAALCGAIILAYVGVENRYHRTGQRRRFA